MQLSYKLLHMDDSVTVKKLKNGYQLTVSKKSTINLRLDQSIDGQLLILDLPITEIKKPSRTVVGIEINGIVNKRGSNSDMYGNNRNNFRYVLDRDKMCIRDSYYMATSKYFVNNVNFMESFKKRKKQVEVQTMHGTPLKTLGLDVPGELPTEEARQKFIKKCSRWDYLVVQSSKAESITSSCYAFKKEFLKTGYPRNCLLYTSIPIMKHTSLN